MIQIWYPWKLFNFQDLPSPPCPSTSKISPPPWSWTFNSKFPDDNHHLKEIIIQGWLFCTTWKRKQTMEQQRHRACERMKSNTKSRPIQIDLAQKQCNGIIKRWLHCLTSESKGKFIFNNILMFDSACWSWRKSNFL